jgi:lipopolysaccharide assembly outer membrane protein LptD (OstA)
MKKTILAACLVGVAAGLSAGRALAQQMDKIPLPAQPSDTGLEITAEKFEVDRKTGWTTASGDVRIKTGEHEMRADRVRLHQVKGDVQARGNVVIQQRSFGAWSGDYIEYNYKTGKGLTGIGELQAGVFRVGAKEVTRREDGRYDAHNAEITTCTHAPGHRHWCMTGHARYKDNDYVEVFDAVPWLFGVPFAYLPYWFRDLDTHYGFRLVPGYTSRWGAYILGGYVYNIYDSPHGAGPKLDASTHLDYRTERGVAVGQNLRWNLEEWGRGKFESYYAWDRDPPNNQRDRNWMSDVEDDRYRFRLFHEADLSPRDQFILRGTVNSDSEMRHDFFMAEERGESTPMNFVSLEHREHTWAAGAVASGPLNDFYTGVARLPEGWLNIVPQPLFGSGLNYESQTRAGYLNRDAAHYERALPEFMYYPGSWADYNLARADTAHRVTAPLKIGDALSMVPRAGYRATWYSDAENDSNVTRQSAELGVEASMRATADLANGYRHVVEPYIDYSFQPTHFDLDNGRAYSFDRFDRSVEWFDPFGMDGTWLPYDWHGVRPGVRNLLQTRDENGHMRTVLDWDVYTAIQFDSEGPLNEEGLRMAGSKLLITPNASLDIKAQGEWDTEEETFAYVDLSAFYKLNEKIRLGGGYLARDHQLYDYDVSPVMQWNRVDEQLVYGGLTHDVNDAWSWSTYTRYDLRRNDLDEIGGHIQYRLDCLVFQLRVAYQNAFDRIDDSKRRDDFRIAFMMWLRAENRSPDDEWLTW